MSGNNGQPQNDREYQIREAVAKLACLILNAYTPPDRFCVVISIQGGPSARLAHHCSNGSGSLEEVAGGYSVVAAAAMHAGRMAVIESAPPDDLNIAVARFFQETQKHLKHFEQAETSRLDPGATKP